MTTILRRAIHREPWIRSHRRRSAPGAIGCSFDKGFRHPVPDVPPRSFARAADLGALVVVEFLQARHAVAAQPASGDHGLLLRSALDDVLKERADIGSQLRANERR